MKKILVPPAFLIGLAFAPMSAQAHCDAVDGPVATAAVKALDTGTSTSSCPSRQPRPSLS